MTTTSTPEPTTARSLLIRFAEASYKSIAAAAAATEDPHFACRCAQASYAGAAAFLLDQFAECVSITVADDVAGQLDDWLTDGGDLAEWVGEQLGAARAEELVLSVRAAVAARTTGGVR